MKVSANFRLKTLTLMTTFGRHTAAIRLKAIHKYGTSERKY